MYSSRTCMLGLADGMRLKESGLLTKGSDMEKPTSNLAARSC